MSITNVNAPYSVISLISRVLKRLDKRSAQKRSGLRSMHIFDATSFRKPAGDS